jgi:uncharacterized protein YxjI
MQTAKRCPKCGFNAAAAFSDCPSCGVIVGKFKARNGAITDGPPESESGQDGLTQAPRLSICQQKEMGEILTGIETRNRYEVMDHFNRRLYEAEEESGSMSTMLIRMLLKAMRPFTLHLHSNDGVRRYTLKRPFRFYFHEIEIFNAFGRSIGTVKKRFSFMRRIYTVCDTSGRELYQLFGPILRPWTFRIMKNQMEVGTITKKWSGLLKEAFTDADNFGILFPDGIDIAKKAILLGAVFLIDQVHFENSGNN